MKFWVQPEKTQLCKKWAQIENPGQQIILNFKSDPESINIPNSNPKLASTSKSNPKPKVPNQHKDFKP